MDMRRTWKSSTITGDEDLNSPFETDGLIEPVHPGETLKLDFLEPLGLSPITVAKACGVPRTRIERLVRGETAVTADTALRLARYFAMSPAFWLNLQASYDLRCAAANARDEIAKIEPLNRDAAE
jgi:addiction module HigA family antidote